MNFSTTLLLILAFIAANLPSWKRRKAQPLVLDGVSVSSTILEERSTQERETGV